MRLQRRKSEDPPIEIRVTVPAEMIADLKAYCRYYESTYEEAIELPVIVVEILRHFLKMERQFLRWRHSEDAARGDAP
jgi:hypothetical protein